MRQINCHSCSLFVWSKTCGFTYLQLQDHVINHTLFVTLTKNNIIVLPQLSYCTDEIPPNFIFFFFLFVTKLTLKAQSWIVTEEFYVTQGWLHDYPDICIRRMDL